MQSPVRWALSAGKPRMSLLVAERGQAWRLSDEGWRSGHLHTLAGTFCQNGLGRGLALEG